MEVRVRCPACNHRLFDLISKDVELFIKCPTCKKVIHVMSNKVEVKHTEQRSRI